MNADEHGVKIYLLASYLNRKIFTVNFLFRPTIFIKTATRGDIDFINVELLIVYILFNSNSTFVGNRGFAGIPAGNKRNNWLHEG